MPVRCDGADAVPGAGAVGRVRGRAPGAASRRRRRLGQYKEFSLTVACEAANARDRLYYVRLPPNYDPARPYRTVYLGPGCGPPQDLVGETKVYPMETASDPDAILVAMEQGFYNKAEYNSANCTDRPRTPAPAATCATTASTTARPRPLPESFEYGYFDRLHKQVENDFCVDTTRQFFAGYSSGGWMAHQLGCQFPDVLRAQGSVTGGLPAVIRDGVKTCVDHPIAAFLIHDAQDTSNVYAGSVAALERLLQLNNCGAPDAVGAHRAVHDRRRPQQRRLQLRPLHRLPGRIPDRLLHVARQGARRPDHRRRPRLLAVLRELVSAANAAAPSRAYAGWAWSGGLRSSSSLRPSPSGRSVRLPV